jgi:hypothetical protein
MGIDTPRSDAAAEPFLPTPPFPASRVVTTRSAFSHCRDDGWMRMTDCILYRPSFRLCFLPWIFFITFSMDTAMTRNSLMFWGFPCAISFR